MGDLALTERPDLFRRGTLAVTQAYPGAELLAIVRVGLPKVSSVADAKLAALVSVMP